MGRWLAVACAAVLPVHRSPAETTVFDPSTAGAMVARAGTPGAPEFEFVDGSGWRVGGSETAATATLTTPPLRVTSPSGITVVLEHEYDFESDDEEPDEIDAFDGAQVDLSIDGAEPLLVEGWTRGGYPPDIDGVDGLGFEAGWHGNSGGTLVSEAMVGGLRAGQVVRLVLKAGWDIFSAQPSPNWRVSRLVVDGAEPIAEPAPVNVRTVFGPADSGGLAVGGGPEAPPFEFEDGIGWRVGRSEVATRSTLTTPPLPVAASGPVVASLRHAFDFEFDPSPPVDRFDGARLTYSINGGPFLPVTSWQAGGYPEVRPQVEALDFESGWSGPSGGMAESEAVVRDLRAGDTVAFRFEAGWDDAEAAPAPNWTLASFLASNIGDPSTAGLGLRIERDGASGAPVLTWRSTPGRSYRIERTDDAEGDTAAWEIVEFGIPAASDGSVTTWTDAASGGAPRLFYRVVRE